MLKIIQKYLQACQTFWSFYNFRKIFGTSKHSRSLLKIIQKYLQACQTFWSFYNFRKMFGTSRTSMSLLKIIQKYLQAWQTFWSFYNFRKMFLAGKKMKKKNHLLAAGFEPTTSLSTVQSSTIMPPSQVQKCRLIRVNKVNVISKTWPQQPLTYICWTHIWVHYTTIISSSSANLHRPVRSFENSSFGGS